MNYRIENIARVFALASGVTDVEWQHGLDTDAMERYFVAARVAAEQSGVFK